MQFQLEDGQFLLESLNANFKPYTVFFNDLAEVWQFYSYTSRVFPEPQTDLDIVLKEFKELWSVVKVKS